MTQGIRIQEWSVERLLSSTWSSPPGSCPGFRSERDPNLSSIKEREVLSPGHIITKELIDKYCIPEFNFYLGIKRRSFFKADFLRFLFQPFNLDLLELFRWNHVFAEELIFPQPRHQLINSILKIWEYRF